MNILVFSWRDPKHPKAGGAEQVMHEHMKGWVKAGNKVTLFSSRVEGLEEKEKLEGIEVIRQGYQYLGVQFAGFIYYLKNRDRYDLVVDQFHGIPFFTPLFVRKPKLAVIQEVAGKVWLLNPLPWPMNWVIGLIGLIGEPLVFLIYRTTHFMTGSESAKRDVVKMGIPLESITVVPHGVISGQWTVDSGQWKKAKEKTVVFLGVLSKDKGIEDAIRCFAILHSKYSDWNFWVIGRAETPQFGEKMKNLVRELGLEKKVKFWGFVTQQKKFELLSKARILINPSVHEGWGLVNTEASIVGTPVVAYSNAGLVDSVKDGVSGILCGENTAESLAKNVEDVLNDGKKYLELSKGAKKWSQNFSWEKSKKQSLKLVNQLFQK